MFQVTTVLPKPNEAISKIPTFERVGQEEEELAAREATETAGGKAKKGGDKGETKEISLTYAKKLAAKHKKKGEPVPPEVQAVIDSANKDKEAKAGGEGVDKPKEEEKKEEVK